MDLACTLEELQKTEYDILCRFADFCDAHKITYVLSGGSLLGAVRHNGFIPWDDDVDVHMDCREFKKFVRCYRRDPIPGMHLSWIDTDAEHPYCFAKLRRNGTFMPDRTTKCLDEVDTHSGIWLDIFAFTGKPRNAFLAKLQQTIYRVYGLLTFLPVYELVDSQNENGFQYSAKYRRLQKLSRAQRRRLRKLLFFLYTALGSGRSECITYNYNYNNRAGWTYDLDKKILRSYEQPVTKHVFEDREFLIPQNYDAALTFKYGDYMTPKEFPVHADLSRIQIYEGE